MDLLLSLYLVSLETVLIDFESNKNIDHRKLFFQTIEGIPEVKYVFI